MLHGPAAQLLLLHGERLADDGLFVAGHAGVGEQMIGGRLGLKCWLGHRDLLLLSRGSSNTVLRRL
jgi:hypothetical protein